MSRVRGHADALADRATAVVAGLATTRHRLVGLALLRLVIGATTVLFCVADYGNRQFLWGPTTCGES